MEKNPNNIVEEVNATNLEVEISELIEKLEKDNRKREVDRLLMAREFDVLKKLPKDFFN